MVKTCTTVTLSEVELHLFNPKMHISDNLMGFDSAQPDRSLSYKLNKTFHNFKFRHFLIAEIKNVDTSIFSLRTSGSGLRNYNFRLPTSDFGLQTSDIQHPTSNLFPNPQKYFQQNPGIFLLSYKPNPSNMKYSEFDLNDSQNFRFFVRKWNPETTPKGLVLLIHGHSDHGGRFKIVAEAFVKEGFIFVAPDLRGNGKTEGKRGHFDTLDQMMADIKFLLEDCKKSYPGIPVALYSQSMGGNLSINYALRFPGDITCVVASSPWLRLTKPPAAPVQWAAALLHKLSPGFVIPNGLNGDDLCHDKAEAHAYIKDPLNHGKVSVSTFFNIKESGEWAIKNAPTLKIPVLLMHGDADSITSYAASQEFHKNSNSFLSFLTFKGLFHELHNEPGEKEMIVGKAVEWVKMQVAAG